MEKIIEEKKRQGSKFLQWVWLGVLFFVFLEIPRLLTFLFGLVMVGLTLATLFELYLLFKRPDASLEGRCFDWACLLLTVAMLLCLPLDYSKMRIDGLCF